MAETYNPQAPLSAFDSAAQRTDAQKRALLDAVATGGQAGAQAYQEAQAANQAARQQALAAATGNMQGSPLGLIPGGSQSQTAPVQQEFARRDADIAQAQGTLAADTQRQALAGEDFFGRMQSAIPITESRTRASVEQIIREQEEAARERALALQMQQLQLEGQREAIAAQREARAFDAQMRQQELKAQNNPKLAALDPIDQAQLRAMNREERQAAEDSAFARALAAGGGLDAQGNATPRGAAIEALVNGGDADFASMTPADRSAVARAVQQYYSALGQSVTVDTAAFSRNRISGLEGSMPSPGGSKFSSGGGGGSSRNNAIGSALRTGARRGAGG